MNTAELFLWILDNLNYWVVTLFMAIESSFIPFPSEVVVPPAAWKAMNPDSGMSFILVIVFATIGANIGALINYYLAKWVGRPIIYRFADSRIGHMCLIDRQKVEVAEEYFRKHGAASTIFGRLVPAVPINQYSSRFGRYAYRQILALYHNRCWHLEYCFSNHRLGDIPIYRL